MRIKLNHKDNSSAIKSVTITCSVIESLIIPRALRSFLEDTNTHYKDREIARKMLGDWIDFVNGYYQDGEVK